ncbi:hypothetical protein Tco_0712575 [Tanacetum coccineum]
MYVEKNTMEVVFGKGKGVLIEEIMDDDEVKEASETGNKDDEAEENAELFDEVDHLLEHVPFIKETMVGVDAPLVVVDAPVIALEE